MKIIDSWNEMSIDKFLKIHQINELHTADKNFEYLAILADTTVEELMNTNFEEVGEMMKKLNFLTKEPLPNLIRFTYELNGKKYKVLKNVNEMTTAQYIDYTTFNQNPELNVVEMLSVVLIPEGCTYNNGYDIEEAKDDIRNYLSVCDGLAISAFFLTKCKLRLRFLIRATERMLKRAPKELQERQPALDKLKELRDMCGFL